MGCLHPEVYGAMFEVPVFMVDGYVDELDVQTVLKPILRQLKFS